MASMLVSNEDLYSDSDRIRAWIMSVEGAQSVDDVKGSGFLKDYFRRLILIKIPRDTKPAKSKSICKCIFMKILVCLQMLLNTFH